MMIILVFSRERKEFSKYECLLEIFNLLVQHEQSSAIESSEIDNEASNDLTKCDRYTYCPNYHEFLWEYNLIKFF